MKRPLLLPAMAGILLTLILLWPGPVAAHAELVTAVPAPGASLTKSPATIQITFNEPLLAGSQIKLLTPEFRTIANVQTSLSGPEANQLQATLPRLAVGLYTVEWLAIGQDGHPTQGSYQFEIRQPVLPTGTFLWLLLALTYAVAGGITLYLGAVEKRLTSRLVLYLFTASLWVALEGLIPLEVTPFTIETGRFLTYGLLLLTALFLYLSQAFLQNQQIESYWWGVAFLGVIAFAILDINPAGWPDDLLIFAGRVFTRTDTAEGLAFISWVSLIGGAITLTVRAYRQTKQRPLHRNRIIYWAVVITLLIIGNGFIFAGRFIVGSFLQLPAILLATYAMLVYRLYDLRRAARWFLTLAIILPVLAAAYLAILTGSRLLGEQLSLESELNQDISAIVALFVLVLLFQPTLNLILKWVNRVTAGSVYNRSSLVREYSQTISNIVDLQRLEGVGVRLISEAMQIRHGTLYLVDQVPGRGGEPDTFVWKSVNEFGLSSFDLGSLSADNPVAGYLRDERRPLTQFDVDMLPRFNQLSEAQRHWLIGLGIEVYVPIHSKEAWIGLLALGPKESGDRYYEEDLELLSTLADQTGVALQNARLVADLKRLNRDLRQAYEDLEKASRQLQEVDKLKSAFIGVITHEIRTPFSNIAFSVQILDKFGTEHLVPEQQEQFEQLQQQVKSARTMIDGLVTFASFLSKQGELNLEWVTFDEVLEEALVPLKPLADKKEIAVSLSIPEDLPELEADKARLVDAVHHLTHNALKFTPEGGQIWVKSWAETDSLHFEVQDNGIGIPADQLDHLWEEFNQMADPHLRSAEGLGLGLALVKFVINAHGGRVSASSEEGVGSTFGFELPA